MAPLRERGRGALEPVRALDCLDCPMPTRRHHPPVAAGGLGGEAYELELGERGCERPGLEPGCARELVRGRRAVRELPKYRTCIRADVRRLPPLRCGEAEQLEYVLSRCQRRRSLPERPVCPRRCHSRAPPPSGPPPRVRRGAPRRRPLARGR